MFDPDAIDENPPPMVAFSNGGRCMFSSFPGLETGVDGTAYIDPDAMGRRLRSIAGQGAKLLIVLTEEAELPTDAHTLLRQTAQDTGIETAFLPVPDYHAPDAATMARWHDLDAQRTDTPRSGGTMACCCHFGAGRSGSFTAYILITLGLDLDQAVTKVRAARKEAIESEEQMAWLRAVSARLKDDSPTLDLE
jgi:protein-tyrosine phosphatase